MKKRLSLKNILITLCTVSIASLSIGIIANALTAETKNVYFDPATNNIIFTSTDKMKSSDTFYRTLGFTISDGMWDSNGNLVDTGLGEFNIALEDPANDRETREYQQNGVTMVETKWTIPYDVVLEKIAATSPEWYNKLNNPTGDVHLKLDALIGVNDPNKNSLDPNGEYFAGLLNATTAAASGEVWGKEGLAGFSSYADLIAKYPWIAPYIDEHMLQALTLLLKEEPEITNPAEMIDSSLAGIITNGEVYARIGKDAPDYWTYNYNPTGQFDIGDGIPTSEDVTNGYEADRWYGNAVICQRGKGGSKASHDWSFNGMISWEETGVYVQDEVQPDGSVEPVVHTYTYTVSAPHGDSVNRQVQYWYLGHAAIYDFTRAVDANTVFPEGTHTFNNGLDVPVHATANGVSLTGVSNYNFVPDDNAHVQWPVLTSSQLYIEAHGKSRGDAEAQFKAIAEDRVIPAEEIYVQNDELTVDGHTFMSSAPYQYREFQRSGPGDKSYTPMGESDYGEESDEENGTIPSNIANGRYTTTITATYTQVVLGTHANKDFSKSGKGAIKAGYVDNEPVVVHTPTVSSVILLDSETYQRLDPTDPTMQEKLKTQLVTEAYNSEADYQLLLDGTYTIEFISEVHFAELFERGCFNQAPDYTYAEYEEYYHYIRSKCAVGDFDFTHPGYTEMADTLYDKYCEYRQACFPFTVQIDGKIYEPDEYEFVDNDSNKPRKERGYTEWIDLPVDAHFRIDFYIPSWATEGKEHVVIFRVAPENVIDHEGVDHLEQEDFEWLNNTTLNGVPLYEYVSTYTCTVQLSGRIYDFQATGIDAKDIYFGNNPKTGESWGYSWLAQCYAFCPNKEEKRTGIYNRLGGESVRYSVDGTLTNDWDERNTLPFSVGRSHKYSGEGCLKKGHTFTYTVKTMSNLWNEVENPAGEDFLVIEPSYRYYDENGVEDRSVDVYSTQETLDGNEILYFVPFGTDQDKALKRNVKIADIRFDGSYYTNFNEYLSDLRVIPNEYQADDAEYSKDKCNRWMYDLKIAAVPTWPEEAYKTTNNYLNRETPSYSMSEIVLNSRLRLLTGNLEQLEMNLDNEGSSLEYLMDKTPSGASYKVKEVTNPELWDKHRMSMQTWFGAYWIPYELYVTDDTFEADTDEDGTPETYDNIWEYVEENGSIEGNEEFFKKDGYLVIKFNIYTVNDGKKDLLYYGGNKDQWQMEGCPDEVEAGDKAFDETVDIPVESGDVAVIDLEHSAKEGWVVGYNRIN